MAPKTYATYQSDRLGNLLTVRDSNRPEPVAQVRFPAGQRVTYRSLNKALADHGYTVDGNWRPRRRILRADLIRLDTLERA